MNYKKEIEIDRLDLDSENCRLPTANFICHEELAEKIKERDDCKLELEVLEAKIDKEIRNTAEKKPSETQIKNMVIMDIRRHDKVKEYNELNEEVNILKGAVNSFDKKNSALKNLTNLYTSEYYVNGFKKKSQREGLNK